MIYAAVPSNPKFSLFSPPKQLPPPRYSIFSSFSPLSGGVKANCRVFPDNSLPQMDSQRSCPDFSDNSPAICVPQAGCRFFPAILHPHCTPRSSCPNSSDSSALLRRALVPFDAVPAHCDACGARSGAARTQFRRFRRICSARAGTARHGSGTALARLRRAPAVGRLFPRGQAAPPAASHAPSAARPIRPRKPRFAFSRSGRCDSRR